MARRSSENAHLRRSRNCTKVVRRRADRIRQLRRRTLDVIHPAPGCARQFQHPNKAPQVTYLSGVLEVDRRATDPADVAPAAAPSIAPGSAKPDGFGVPKTPRHGRKVAGEWGQRHVPRSDAKLSVCEVQTHGNQEDALRSIFLLPVWRYPNTRPGRQASEARPQRPGRQAAGKKNQAISQLQKPRLFLMARARFFVFRASTLHRAPVGQGPPGPGWLAISLGFWSGRALATGTAWAGLFLIHHHHLFFALSQEKTGIPALPQLRFRSENSTFRPGKPRLRSGRQAPRGRYFTPPSKVTQAVEQIQRKFRVRERTPQNAPRMRAGATKTDQKAELKKIQIRRRYPPKPSVFFFMIPLIIRQARDAKSPKWKRSDRRPAAQQDPPRRSGRRSGRARGGSLVVWKYSLR